MPFAQPQMRLFSGACTVIVRAGTTPGAATLRVSAPGVKKAEMPIIIK